MKSSLVFLFRLARKTKKQCAAASNRKCKSLFESYKQSSVSTKSIRLDFTIITCVVANQILYDAVYMRGVL
ncbi:hypothetical protein ABID22_000380 [Pontibacter aydingkolensis]